MDRGRTSEEQQAEHDAEPLGGCLAGHAMQREGEPRAQPRPHRGAVAEQGEAIDGVHRGGMDVDRRQHTGHSEQARGPERARRLDADASPPQPGVEHAYAWRTSLSAVPKASTSTPAVPRSLRSGEAMLV